MGSRNHFGICLVVNLQGNGMQVFQKEKSLHQFPCKFAKDIDNFVSRGRFTRDENLTCRCLRFCSQREPNNRTIKFGIEVLINTAERVKLVLHFQFLGILDKVIYWTSRLANLWGGRPRLMGIQDEK